MTDWRPQDKSGALRGVGSRATHCLGSEFLFSGRSVLFFNPTYRKRSNKGPPALVSSPPFPRAGNSVYKRSSEPAFSRKLPRCFRVGTYQESRGATPAGAESEPFADGGEKVLGQGHAAFPRPNAPNRLRSPALQPADWPSPTPLPCVTSVRAWPKPCPPAVPYLSLGDSRVQGLVAAL